MPKFKIDNTEYDTDTISDEAKAQLGSLQFVEMEIQRLQAKLAAMQTARMAYVGALKQALEKGSQPPAAKIDYASDSIQFS